MTSWILPDTTQELEKLITTKLFLQASSDFFITSQQTVFLICKDVAKCESKMLEGKTGSAWNSFSPGNIGLNEDMNTDKDVTN